MNTSRYPNFLLIGAARAGTTAVDRYLRQHPQVFLPRVKEPCFFAFADKKPSYRRGKFAFAATSAAKYESLYADRKPGQLAGDLSTPYLYLYQQTIANIRRYHPAPDQLRIIAVLRHPVDRAYSQYRWRLRDGREQLSFREAIEAESQRKAEGYSFDYFYTERSFYAAALLAYREYFPNLKVLLYDDLCVDPKRFIRELCQFVGVDPDFGFKPTGMINATWSPRFPWLSRLVTLEHPLKYRLLNMLPTHWRDNIRDGFARMNSKALEESGLDPGYRKELTRLFTEDIRVVETITGRNLEAWTR